MEARRPRIVVDGMWSDKGFGVVIEGVELAIDRGIEAEINLVLNEGACDWVKYESTIDDKGVVIIRCSDDQRSRARDSSVAICAQMVRDGKADAFYSCGNTQLATTWATVDKGVGMLEGFSRPPLALVVPNRKLGQSVLLDAGANVDCSPAQLVEFAKLGHAFAQIVFGAKRPVVRLLANGTEDYKGTEIVQEAAELIKSVDQLRFQGLTEGNKILRGDSHVIVADGFLGNIAFKSLEDGAGFLVEEMRDAFRANWWTKFVGSLARPILRPVRAKLDPSKYGSMPLLGTRKLVMIGHGSADAEAVCAGLFNTAGYLEKNLAKEMEIRLGLLEM